MRDDPQELEAVSVRRHLPHVPLLWVCVPLMAGLAVACATGKGDALVWAMGGASFTALAFIISFFIKASAQTKTVLFWKLLFFAGIFCLGGGYYLWRVPPTPAQWRAYPPRELTVTVEVDRVFGPTGRKYPSVSGLGYLRQVPEFAKELTGRRISFQMFGDGQGVLPGALIEMTGVAEAVDPARDGFSRYLDKNGIGLALRRAVLVKMQKPAGAFRQKCAELNTRFEEILSAGFSRENAGVFAAMMLGKTRALSAGQKQSFTLTGTMHLFAISGLHVALVGGILFLLLRTCRVSARLLPWAVLALLFMYVAVTGFAPSALRAFLMIAFIWGAYWAGRPNDGLVGLVMSAVCILIWDPSFIGNTGFQLSYAVVASIFLYGLPLAKFFDRRFQPYRDIPASSLSWARRLWARVQRGLWGTLAISLSAFLLSTPLCAEAFGTFALGSVALNLLLVPAAGVVLGAGVLSLLLGLLHAPVWLIVPFNAVGIALTQAMAWLTQKAQQWLAFLFHETQVSWNYFGAICTLILLGALVLWRERLDGQKPSYYLLPFGLWGFLISMGYL